jgi:hypothetical protein
VSLDWSFYLFLIFALDKHRYRPMSTDMIVDALRHYPASIVVSTIQGFVLDNGGLFLFL